MFAYTRGIEVLQLGQRRNAPPVYRVRTTSSQLLHAESNLIKVPHVCFLFLKTSERREQVEVCCRILMACCAAYERPYCECSLATPPCIFLTQNLAIVVEFIRFLQPHS